MTGKDPVCGWNDLEPGSRKYGKVMHDWSPACTALTTVPTCIVPEQQSTSLLLLHCSYVGPTFHFSVQLDFGIQQDDEFAWCVPTSVSLASTKHKHFNKS